MGLEKKEIKALSKKQLKSHEVLKDELGRKKIRLYVYKGNPVASRELTETDRQDKKLRLFRLKVDFLEITDKVSVDMLVVKDHIEELDIDHTLLEHIFSQFFDRKEKARALIRPLLEVYDSAKPGQLIGDITLDYDHFLKMANYIAFLVREPIKKEIQI